MSFLKVPKVCGSIRYYIAYGCDIELVQLYATACVPETWSPQVRAEGYRKRWAYPDFIGGSERRFSRRSDMVPVVLSYFCACSASSQSSSSYSLLAPPHCHPFLRVLCPSYPRGHPLRRRFLDRALLGFYKLEIVATSFLRRSPRWCWVDLVPRSERVVVVRSDMPT